MLNKGEVQINLGIPNYNNILSKLKQIMEDPSLNGLHEGEENINLLHLGCRTHGTY